jgi:tetratricopeptide (TPR) repeat protein
MEARLRSAQHFERHPFSIRRLTFAGPLPILPGMKRLLGVLLTGIALCAANFTVCAETEQIDLKALAKKARPAVMLLVISDANGKEIGTGTGFLVSADGKLITNFHVIEKAASAIAKSENGGLFPVEGVLASDPKNDLALLKIKGKELPFLTLGKSENIEVGTRIAVIGSPLGLEGTLSEGIVSAVRELMGDIRKLQITAAISPGSSGSPVMNTKGDVIGIAVAQLKGGQALNLAVPVECANLLLAKVKPTDALQPLKPSANASDEDAIYSDPDWRAAYAAQADKDYVEMLKRTKLLVTRHPENSIAWYALGGAYSGLKFFDDALVAYRQAVKIQPDDASAWFGLGFVTEQSGRTEEAVAAYRQVVKIKPDHIVGWLALGDAFQKSGHTDEEIAAYRQAIKIQPDCAHAWLSLGTSYERHGRAKEAIEAGRQAVKIKPDFPLAWVFLVLHYMDNEQYDRALEAIGELMKYDPERAKALSASAWNGLVLHYMENEQYDRARKALGELSKYDPGQAKKLSELLQRMAPR